MTPRPPTSPGVTEETEATNELKAINDPEVTWDHPQAQGHQ